MMLEQLKLGGGLLTLALRDRCESGDGTGLWDGSVYEELHSWMLLWRGKTVEKSAVHGWACSFLPFV